MKDRKREFIYCGKVKDGAGHAVQERKCSGHRCVIIDRKDNYCHVISDERTIWDIDLDKFEEVRPAERFVY